jgi:hypothetical protein
MTPQDDSIDDLAFLAWLRAVAPEAMANWHRVYQSSHARPAGPGCESCLGTGRIIDRFAAEGGARSQRPAGARFCDCATGSHLASLAGGKDR